MIRQEHITCPLIYASYLGDDKTVEGLLFGGDWPQESLDLSLMYATGNGWLLVMATLYIDGRADQNYMLSSGANEAALLGRLGALQLAVTNGVNVRNLRSSLIWLAHLGRYEELKLILDHDTWMLNSKVLKAAIRGKSRDVIDLLLGEKWTIDDEEVMEMLMDLPNMQELVPVVLAHRAPISQRVFANRNTRFSDENAELIRAAHIKRRWMQVKAVLHIWNYWQQFIMDYYCPGNDRYPEGKGFKRAQRNFYLLSK